MGSQFRKVKISQSIVDAAKPEAQRYVLADAAIPGFWVVVMPTGRKTFAFRYRVGGGRGGTVREPKIGDASAMRAEKARKIAEEWHATVKLGGDPSAERQAQRVAPVMNDLFRRYLADHAKPHKRASSVAEDERLIALYLAAWFGRRKVVEVSRADVDKFHKSLAEKPYRANRCIALLSKGFNLAEIWGWRSDGSNPCRHVKKFAEEKRQRYLSAEELGRLGETLRIAERDGFLELPTKPALRMNPERVAIGPSPIAAIRLLVLTGARKSEILSLKWSDINTAAQAATIADAKEMRTVKGKAVGQKSLVLSPQTLDVLGKLKRLEGCPYVIPGRKPGASLVNLKDPWLAIREHAGLDDVRVHDLRHSFASVGAANGTSLPIIGALLGHSQPSTTARYAHLHADPLQAAATTIGEEISAAMGGARNHE